MNYLFVFANQFSPGTGRSGPPGSGDQLEILGWETGLDRVAARIGELRPGVVIVAHQGAVAGLAPALVDISEAHPGIRVVEINLADYTDLGGVPEAPVAHQVRELLAMLDHRSAAGRHERDG